MTTTTPSSLGFGIWTSSQTARGALTLMRSLMFCAMDNGYSRSGCPESSNHNVLLETCEGPPSLGVGTRFVTVTASASTWRCMGVAESYDLTWPLRVADDDEEAGEALYEGLGTVLSFGDYYGPRPDVECDYSVRTNTLSTTVEALMTPSFLAPRVSVGLSKSTRTLVRVNEKVVVTETRIKQTLVMLSKADFSGWYRTSEVTQATYGTTYYPGKIR